MDTESKWWVDMEHDTGVEARFVISAASRLRAVAIARGFLKSEEDWESVHVQPWVDLPCPVDR